MYRYGGNSFCNQHKGSQHKGSQHKGSQHRGTLAIVAMVALGLSGLSLGLSGCGGGEPASRAESVFTGEYPLHAVVTTGMVGDLVRHVGGEHVAVTQLMGENIDPHGYTPTRGDVKQLIEADVVFYSGLMLEGRMADTFTRVARSGRPVYAVTEQIDPSYLRDSDELEGHWDPHVWMDVSAWSRCAEFVTEALAAFDPPHAEDYRRNAEAYRRQLKELDDYVHRIVASVPEQQRVLVTAHDAFGYFARAYGIEVMAAQGISTQSQAGVNDINRLVDVVVRRKIGAIFVETSVLEDNIRAIVEGAARRGWEVHIGGSLFSDAMGAPGTYEGTYIGMIDHNATTIVRSLGGEAPHRGFQGKLAGGG